MHFSTASCQYRGTHWIIQSPFWWKYFSLCRGMRGILKSQIYLILVLCSTKWLVLQQAKSFAFIFLSISINMSIAECSNQSGNSSGYLSATQCISENLSHFVLHSHQNDSTLYEYCVFVNRFAVEKKEKIQRWWCYGPETKPTAPAFTLVHNIGKRKSFPTIGPGRFWGRNVR